MTFLPLILTSAACLLLVQYGCSDSVTLVSLIESLERDMMWAKISSGPEFVIYRPWTMGKFSNMNFDGTI